MVKALNWTITPDETTYEGGDIHCLPNNDLKPHIEQIYCPCEPRVTDITEWGQVISHNAFDEREIIERLFDDDSED